MKNRWFPFTLLLLAFLSAVLLASTFVAAAPPSGGEKMSQATWLRPYITEVPPILMREPFLEVLGQTAEPVPYTYEEAVKLTGHSCGAVAGAWVITKKALEALYPDSLPVRGQIRVTMPGSEDEWYVGVFGEVIGYITGAAPKTGFPGGELGPNFNRRDLMVYAEKPIGTPPPKMVYIFERADTGAKVAVRYDLSKVQPPTTPEFNAMSAKAGAGSASDAELKAWQAYWNERAIFVLKNADLPGLFEVRALQ